MKNVALFFHPLRVVRAMGLADGVSLLVLFGIAMPLKYGWEMPYAVTLAGTAHGGIFAAYFLAIVYAQLRLQWPIRWSALCLLAGVVPFANFVLDRYLRKNEAAFTVKPLPREWLVYTVVLFTFIDLFTQLPVMSTFAASLGASAALAGFIVGLYSLSNTLGNVLAGILTDRSGAYPVLCVGLAATSVVLLTYGAVDNAQALMLVRFLHGFLSGLIVPAAFTFLANRTQREKQGSRSAVTGAFVGSAAILGPAYSGIMASRTSVPFVFATVAALGFALFLIVLFALRSTGKPAGKTAADRAERKLRLNRGIAQAFAGAFFLMFSQGALAYLLPLHVESLGYSARLSGTLMSMFGLVAVAMFSLPTNRLFDRVPPLYCFSAGLAILGVSQMLIGQSQAMPVLYAVLALYGFGFSLLFPAMNTLLVHATTPENRGQAYGYFYAFFSVGTVAGSTGIGLLPAAVPTQFVATGTILLLCVFGVLLTAGSYGKAHSGERP
jgi:integral membrane protein